MNDLFSVPVEMQMLAIREYCSALPLAGYTEAVAFMRDKYLKAIRLPPLPASTCKGRSVLDQ